MEAMPLIWPLRQRATQNFAQVERKRSTEPLSEGQTAGIYAGIEWVLLNFRLDAVVNTRLHHKADRKWIRRNLFLGTKRGRKNHFAYDRSGSRRALRDPVTE